jgi:hypothetical protein
MFEDLPGGEILVDGLRDLRRGVRSENALLVLIGRPRFERCGVTVPPSNGDGQSPEHALYDQLVTRLGREQGYSRYNSLLRRLVSLERALTLLHRLRQAEPRSGHPCPASTQNTPAQS